MAFLIAVWVTALSLISASAGASQPSLDQSLAPYFFVEGANNGEERLPLTSTQAHVLINGVIADVTVTQSYENRGTTPISARYVFAASTRAAVHGVTLHVGDRVVRAVIQERREARETFNEAKKSGKTASLLEEQRPNVFSMDVANILPGDEIAVELKYTELLVPSDGEYEFAYPTVVGPRYAGAETAARRSGSDISGVPYLPEAELPSYDFELSATLVMPVPITELTSPSHPLTAQWSGLRRVVVAPDDPDRTGGNRDFVLRYRLAGNDIESGVSLYEHGGEQFFLLMMQPPKRVLPAQVPGREYVFIVDTSGSMGGFPLNTSKELLRDLVGGLRATDRFNVLFFAGGSSLLSPRSLPATPENLQVALGTLDDLQGGGGTELLRALRRAMQLPQESVVSRTFVVVTDGYISAEAETFRYIREHLGTANVFAFGIGSSVNRHLIEGIAEAGMGEPFIVLHGGEASSVSRSFRDYVGTPVLTNVSLSHEGVDVVQMEPSSIPDVLAERPVVVHGKFRGNQDGTITVRGMSGDSEYVRRFEINAANAQADNHVLPYLWARARVRNLTLFSDGRMDDPTQREVTLLGLKYGLLTRFTSFVAVHDVVRSDIAGPLVQQPLPLPEGVSGRAVGVTRGSEPALFWLLVGIAAFGSAMVLLQRALGVRATRSRGGAA